MEFNKLIEKRRSIRAYKEGIEISVPEIEEMIYAAQQAPSWKNSQTGRYYVIISKEKREYLHKNCLADFNKPRTKNAAAFIVTSFKCGISGFAAEGIPTDIIGDGWGAYDLGLQNENLLLRASELGYDTLIMGMRDEAKLREMLDIPSDEKILSVIAVGKRLEDVQKPARNKIEDILKIF